MDTQRIFVELLEHAWPDWNVRWDPNGLSAFFQHLGLEDSSIKSVRDPKYYYWKSDLPALPVAPPDQVDNIYFKQTLLTVRTEAGMAFFGPHMSTSDLLYVGPSLLEKPIAHTNARNLLPRKPLKVAGELFKRLVFRSSNPRPEHQLPIGDATWTEGPSSNPPEFIVSDANPEGLHIDVVSKTISWWAMYPESQICRKLAEAWTGWTAVDWADRIEEHFALWGESIDLMSDPNREAINAIFEELSTSQAIDHASRAKQTSDALGPRYQANEHLYSHAPVQRPDDQNKVDFLNRVIATTGRSLS